MSKPIDLFIIGAQKAGTTSLKNYLMEHPSVLSHPHVEMTYFSDEAEFSQGYEKAFGKYFGKVGDSNQKIVAKNVTISFREEGLQRLHLEQPDAHIVFILREPVSRAYSAHKMAVRGGWMDKPFEYATEAISENSAGNKNPFYRFIIDLGIYSKQIEILEKYFPKDRIHIVLYDDLKKKPQEVAQRFFEILKIDSSFDPDFSKKHNTGGAERSRVVGKILKSLRQKNNPFKKVAKSLFSERYFAILTQKIYRLNNSNKSAKKSEIDNELRLQLKDYYKPFNHKCSELIGIDLSAIWGY